MTTMIALSTSSGTLWIMEIAAARKPYHHGNLRAALLETAAQMVDERGVEALSLRELAREVGVSHAAPRRHFADRRALLDALAQDGFERLARDLDDAVAGAGPSFEARLAAGAAGSVSFASRPGARRGVIVGGQAPGRAARPGPSFEARLAAGAAAYVTFATRHGALLELMFAGKHRDDADAAALRAAADRAFAVMLGLMAEGQATGALRAGDPERVGIVL